MCLYTWHEIRDLEIGWFDGLTWHFSWNIYSSNEICVIFSVWSIGQSTLILSSTSTKPKRWWENFQDHLSWHLVSDANRLYFTKIPMMCRNPRCCHFRPNEVPRRTEALLNSDRWAVHFPVNLGVATEKGWAHGMIQLWCMVFSPYTSANRSFKEAVPQKQFINIPFCRVSRVLHHWVNSVHSRRHIAHSNHSALDHQPGLYVWGGTHGTNYPTDTNGLLRVDEGWRSWCEISEIPQGTYFCWDPRNKFLSWKRRWSKVVSTPGIFQSPEIMLFFLKHRSATQRCKYPWRIKVVSKLAASDNSTPSGKCFV